MKKLLLILMVLFILVCPCLAQEVAKTPSFMDEWGAIIGQIAFMFISIVGSAITCMIFLVIKLIAKKLGFEITEKEEVYLKDKLTIGKDASEAWAIGLKNKPTSHEKMKKALEVADSVMDKTKVKKYAEEKCVSIVEHLLAEDKKKEELSPPSQ